MTKFFLLVSIQFAAVIFLALTGSIFPFSTFLMFLEIILLLFAVWAMAEMKFRFNVFPALLKNSSLVTSGPYRFVRHPMYTSIIFITLIWIANDFGFIRLAVWMLLVIVLDVKSKYEEEILLKEFPEYYEYKSKTSKLIPFIY